MGLLDKRDQLTPYEYDQFAQAHLAVMHSPWSPYEVAMASDVLDWHKISEEEREVIAGILMGFTLQEAGIGCYWREVVAKSFPKPEIINMATAFSAQEGIHQRAYSHLEDTLGLSTYEAFQQNEIALRKLAPFFSSDADLATSLAIFSGAGEGVSLYASFAILLSFAKLGKFKGMQQILSWSVIDEHCLVPGTEVLTSEGWKLIERVTLEDRLAQFDMDTSEISFAKPYKIIDKEYVGNVVQWYSDDLKIDLTVTSDHNMVQRWGKEKWTLKAAKDVPVNCKKSFPVAGKSSVPGRQVLTELERKLIRVQHSKYFESIELDKINSSFAREFLNELGDWATVYKAEHLSLIQAIAVIAGYVAVPYWIFGEGDDSYKVWQCNINIIKKDTISTQDLEKTVKHYSGRVHCVTMPKGTIVTRGDDECSPLITGNCHSKMGIELYHQLISEYPEMKPNEEDIYEGFRLIVENEKAFVNQAFAGRNLESITLDQTIDYIHYRANYKLMELGLEPIFELTGDYLTIKEFFDTMILGKTMNDFFAQSRNGSGYSAILTQDFKEALCT